MSYGRKPYYIIQNMDGKFEFFSGYIGNEFPVIEYDAIAQLVTSMYSYENPKEQIAEFKGEFGDLLRRGLELRPNLYRNEE